MPQGRILRAFSTGRRVYRTASSVPLPTTNAGLEMTADQASFCKGTITASFSPEGGAEER